MNLSDVLCAGLLAQDFRETASRGEWRRFGKFRFFAAGKGEAYYVMPDGKLYFSHLHETEPGQDEVTGKILDNIFDVGCVACKKDVNAFSAARIKARLNADKMLDELGAGK